MLAVRTYWTDRNGTGELDNSPYCTDKQIKVVSKMYPAKRLTYDMLANIENNAYLRPMVRQPYYQLHDHYLNFGTNKINNTDGQYQNTPEIELHYGSALPGIELVMIEVDYLKLPEAITLTEEEVYINDKDTSQLLEWPDYLDSELTALIVSYIMENEMNPRVQTFQPLQQDTPPAPIELGGQ
jgi:hypothetical protein